jgi:Pyruvate/2-oxoacid:ferredoxin oxidoreductase delta subunit
MPGRLGRAEQDMKQIAIVPDHAIYRELQRHLDQQAVGYPRTRSGADVRFLRLMFTPDEARIALHLTFRPLLESSLLEVTASVRPPDQTRRLLERMFQKGSIGRKKKKGVVFWYSWPLVIGMYEAQDGNPSPEVLREAGAYMRTPAYGQEFIAVKPSQMRTIPVNRSITVEHHVAPYDDVRAIIYRARGPFVVVKCICREAMVRRGKPCARTSRLETCLGVQAMGAMALRRGHGREVARGEALDILAQNEKDGLVFQPSGAQDPEFICSCGGCCCGMLSFQKMLPHPVDFWTSNFYAEIELGACTACGTCIAWCQVNAVTLDRDDSRARINLSRCLGCGPCVTSCRAKAVKLVHKVPGTAPPLDEEALYEEIRKNRRGSWGKLGMMLKLALKMRQ